MRDRIQIQRRTLDEPLFGETDATLRFDDSKARWAEITTDSGRVLFAGAAIGDVRVTHRIKIRYDPQVDADPDNFWILLADDRRLDVLRVEDLEERHEWLLLFCNERGEAAKKASSA